MQTFGTRFKNLRTERKLTQDELVLRFNNQFNTRFNKSTISQYENDKRKPEISILENWADFFEVSIDYLLGRSDKRNISAIEEVRQKINWQLKCNSPFKQDEKELIETYKELNDEGKKEAIKRISELTEINKYTVPVTMAAHNDNTDKEQLELMNQDLDEL